MSFHLSAVSAWAGQKLVSAPILMETQLESKHLLVGSDAHEENTAPSPLAREPEHNPATL